MRDQTPVQVAWVTDDLAASERMLSALLGARTWVRMPAVHFGPDTCTHRGEPADFVADISLSYAGDMQLELIAPVRGDSIYTEFLSSHGAGLHHICIAVPDEDAFEAALGDAAAAGAPVVTRGVMPGGMHFGYVSGTDAGVPFVEIAYIPRDIQTFFDHVKQQQQ
ncbi:MAG: VOC family protein [Mycolicibacterium neoaurum]|uniref:VOC family protein n=1 Tax=Mycolicibacterium neoaurum TaxID=1795 RepID=UPI002FFA89BF